MMSLILFHSTRFLARYATSGMETLTPSIHWPRFPIHSVTSGFLCTSPACTITSFLPCSSRLVAIGLRPQFGWAECSSPA
jgi:hypothetical protein